MYYIEKNNKIVLFEENINILKKSLIHYPDLQDLEIKETNRPIINFQFADTEEYEQEQEQKERERLDALSMTRGDMFEALILAFGKTKADIRAMIENIDRLTDVERALYLNRFDEALDFYRGYPAVDLIGKMLGVSSEQLDKFFETKDYKELLSDDEPTEETGENNLSNVDNPTENEDEKPVSNRVSEAEDVDNEGENK